jgi:spore coat protein CotH
VNGPNDVPGGQDDDDNITYTAQDDDNFTYTAQDDDNFTYTAHDDTTVDNNIHAAPVNPFEAWLVDNSKYSVCCVL